MDVAGTLYSTLGEFARREINLAKIESRPTREELGRYIFLVDLDGHRLDEPVAQALARVKAQTPGPRSDSTVTPPAHAKS